MSTPPAPKKAGLLIFVFISGMFFGAIGLGASSSAFAGAGADALFSKLEILSEVIAQINNSYIDPVTPSDLVYAAARGMSNILDENSAFYSPEEYEALVEDTEGVFTGVGLEIESEARQIFIRTVIPHSPAAEAGISPDDRLVSIDDKEVSTLEESAVLALLRGKPGTTIILGIKRADRADLWHFTLRRQQFRPTTLSHKRLPKHILYISIESFPRDIASDLEELIERQSNIKGLIIDLRDNPGGIFEEAIATADLFLDDGLIAEMVGKKNKLLKSYSATAHHKAPKWPIAILLNSESASAAEVVAGALAQRGRARLFGERTYGKGSVQNISRLADGSGLRLTIARYRLPSGTIIDGQGITPHEIIPTSEDGDSDELIKRASQWLLK
ncbi:S41 family peptidase [Myxococcota bacterium]|nr:S41 family peptidase [Myxococcota bacterium]